MATTGAVFPTTATTAAESPWLDNDWTTPTNVTADDGATANVTAATYDTNDQTYVLKCTGFDFSAIPNGSTINGITAVINCWYRSGTGAVSGDLAQILIAGTKGGTNKWSSAQALNTTDTTTYTLGGASDLWGNTLSASDVKATDFGIALGFLATGNNADVDVDYVTLEIDYTPPAAPEGNPGAFFAMF